MEHFEAVRRRLDAGGLFCQWLPLHQLDLDSLRSIVQSFLAVYPQGWALLASNSLETPVLGLVARGDAGASTSRRSTIAWRARRRRDRRAPRAGRRARRAGQLRRGAGGAAAPRR